MPRRRRHGVYLPPELRAIDFPYSGQVAVGSGVRPADDVGSRVSRNARRQEESNGRNISYLNSDRIVSDAERERPDEAHTGIILGNYPRAAVIRNLGTPQIQRSIVPSTDSCRWRTTRRIEAGAVLLDCRTRSSIRDVQDTKGIAEPDAVHGVSLNQDRANDVKVAPIRRNHTVQIVHHLNAAWICLRHAQLDYQQSRCFGW